MVDVRHDVVEAVSKTLDEIGDALELRYERLEEEGLERLAKEGVPEQRRSVGRIAEMRYAGQEHSVVVDLVSGMTTEAIYAAFEVAYKGVFGYTLGAPAEIVNLRVRAVGEIPKPAIREIEEGGPSPTQALKGERQVHDFMSQTWQDWKIYDRSKLQAGNIVSGPALIEEATTTTIVREGQDCAVDRRGNMVITRVTPPA